jgi:hypothetical protein
MDGDAMISDIVRSSDTEAGLKEKHEYLVAVLKDTYSGLIDFAFKRGALLAIAMGWLVTSDDARAFLAHSSTSKFCLCAAVILLTYFHSRWVGVFYCRSVDAHEKLVSLGYMPRDFLDLRLIRRHTYVTFVAVHAATSLVICVLALDARAI